MTMIETIHRLCGETDDVERAGVADPGRLMRLKLLDAATWLLCFAIAWACVFHTPQYSVFWATVVVGVALPVNTFLRTRRRRRARAYQRGWLDGRRLMLGSIEEALRRDMTLHEWMRTEIERDEKVIDHI